jgi:hypothetical protein
MISLRKPLMQTMIKKFSERIKTKSFKTKQTLTFA